MPKRLPSRTQVLEVLQRDDRPWHAREIAAALDVDPGDFPALGRILDTLVMDGVLSPRPGQKFKLGKSSRSDRGEEREGLLSVNARGFAFVAAPSHPKDDVFVGPDALAGGMHGDRVRVKVTARGGRGAEGEVVAVVDRGIKRVAGVLRRRRGGAWLEPDDPRIRGPIPLTAAMDARGPEGNSGNDGDAVIVTITRWPEFVGETPEGCIEAVLGKPGELNVEVAKILAMAQIREVHGEKAVAEAGSYGATVPEDMLAGRRDLTHVPLPTIDPEDARDHDDAVWVERAEDGGYRAYIAIADVSSYVRPGMSLDEEAKARGCSTYLPDRAIPMLPRALSSNLCSLLPHEIRLCLCAIVDLDSGGRVKKSELVRGFMKSAAKLTYGGVARALGLTEKGPRDPAADAMRDDLAVAYELSRLLRGRRMKRGALDFDLPEAKVVLSEDGASVVDVERRGMDAGVKRAYQLIEELMLLANETVAEWLVAKNLPAVFRIHEPPDATKLERLAAMCDVLGVPFDAEATQDPKALSFMLRAFAEHPLAHVLNMLLLRSMKQAAYDVANLGHFGLASRAYLHFTSPIRRYPDLVVHRIVHAVLLGERVGKDGKAVSDLQDAAMTASMAERRSMEVERDVVDLYRASLMKERIGERYEGMVTGLVGSGVFVALDAPFVDVLVRFEDLGAGGYRLDDEGLFAVGERSGDRVGLGDRMVVEIVDASLTRRQVSGRRFQDGRSMDGDGRTRTRFRLKDPGEGGNRKARRGGPPVKGTKGQKKGGGGGGGGPTGGGARGGQGPKKGRGKGGRPGKRR